MNNIDKARELADRLKAEKEEREVQAELTKHEAVSQLKAISNDSVLAKMYAENAQVGAGNLGGESPMLKVHSTGKSTTNELADGTEPNNGWFFYKPTGEQFPEIYCHILTISRGFKAEGMENDKETGKKKITFNQIVGGVITNNGEDKPFLIYLSGVKLSPMWEFGKAAAKYTRRKDLPIPMFALQVKLTARKVLGGPSNQWVNWAIDFEIEKEKDGNPILVSDSGKFIFLRDHVTDLEDMIASIIAKKENVENIRPLATQDVPVDDTMSVSGYRGEGVVPQGEDPDAIPF